MSQLISFQSLKIHTGQAINMGPKWCMNYDSGDYEWIDESGYSWDQGEYVYNWDRSAFDDDDDDDDW